MEIPLPIPVFVIGRDPKCQLRPGSDLISKQHAAILQRPNGVFVRDLKSTNGTFINNDRIQGDVEVKDGDQLRVGPLVFAFKIDASQAAIATPTSGSEEEQAVSWLLEAPTGRDADDFGTKTTIMEGKLSQATPSPDAAAALDDTRVDSPKPAAATADGAKKPGSTAAAEAAGDLLERMLAPQAKKRKK